MAEIALRQYLDRTGRNPFGEWFDGLDTRAFAKVTIALERLREGNFSNVKGVGSGVYERKIDFELTDVRPRGTMPRHQAPYQGRRRGRR